MSQKTKLPLFTRLVYTILVIKPLRAKNFFQKDYQKVYTLNIVRKDELLSTGFFFKKIAFIGLALNIIYINKYYSTTLKSTIRSL